jgi:hypothetical protein
MKYVCLVYLVEKDMDALSTREADACTEESLSHGTKEQPGGFILIEARDLNDAIQVPAKIPMGRRGTIEVGPIKELKR